jgi:hypothetical protein
LNITFQNVIYILIIQVSEQKGYKEPDSKLTAESRNAYPNFCGLGVCGGENYSVKSIIARPRSRCESVFEFTSGNSCKDTDWIKVARDRFQWSSKTVVPKHFQFAEHLNAMTLFAETHENIIFLSSFELGTILPAENILYYGQNGPKNNINHNNSNNNNNNRIAISRFKWRNTSVMLIEN